MHQGGLQWCAVFITDFGLFLHHISSDSNPGLTLKEPSRLRDRDVLRSCLYQSKEKINKKPDFGRSYFLLEIIDSLETHRHGRPESLKHYYQLESNCKRVFSIFFFFITWDQVTTFEFICDVTQEIQAQSTGVVKYTDCTSAVRTRLLRFCSPDI